MDPSLSQKSDASSAIVVSRPRVSDPGQLGTTDMIWAKVYSHPWWPGYILDERLASSEALAGKVPGRVLVHFFGDSTYKWLDPAELIPFAVNLLEKSKQNQSKGFLRAVAESKEEVEWRATLGLYCPCVDPDRLRPSPIRGHINVRGWDYSKKLFKKSIKEFSPKKAQSFLFCVAAGNPEEEDVELIKMRASLLAFRKWRIHDNQRRIEAAPQVATEEKREIEGIPNSSTTLTSHRDIPNSSTISRPSQSEIPSLSLPRGFLASIHPTEREEKLLVEKNKQKEERAKLETAGTSSSLNIHPTVPDSDDLYQLTLPQFSVHPSVLAIKTRTTEEAKKQICAEQRVKQGGSLLKRSSSNLPAKNDLKRPISDRREEGSSAKRPKKLDHLKLLGRKKKAAIKKSDVASKSSPSTSNMGSKQRQESLEEESPTIVNLKFPPNSTLPSIANLKARLVRFGPLIVDQCKVSWKMHSCQVIFKYKTDAIEACSYVRKNNLFGRVEIACTCSAEESGLRCSPMRQQHLETWPPPRRQQPIVPPKSILKQPSDSVTRKKKLSETGKEKLRVMFRLPIDDRVMEQPSPPHSIRLSKPSNSSTFQHKNRPFLPPLPPQPPTSFSYDMFESEQLRLLPQNMNQLRESQQCQLMEQYDGNVAEGENKKKNVDISQQLLSLLRRNHEIVNSLLASADARR